MGALAVPRLTPEAYLELDRKAEWKSEFHDGEMFPIEAASERHALVAANLSGLCWQALRGKGCRCYLPPFRVKADKTKYVYPDITIVCGAAILTDNHDDTLTNPVAIIEVLSPSTEDYNFGRKFRMYRSIATVQEYVLVSQSEPRIDVYRRVRGDVWTVSEPSIGLESSLALDVIGTLLSPADIYEHVEFPG